MFIYFSLFIFHEISDHPWPIAVKLLHINDIWVRFIIRVQNSGALIKEIWGQKHAKFLQNESRYPKSERRDRELFPLRSAKEVWWTLVHYPESRTCKFGHTRTYFFGKHTLWPLGVLATQIFTGTTDKGVFADGLVAPGSLKLGSAPYF